MRKNIYHVRVARIDDSDSVGAYSEWVGPIVAPGPFVAGKDVAAMLAADVVVSRYVIEVYCDERDYCYVVTVSKISATHTTVRLSCRQAS